MINEYMFKLFIINRPLDKVVVTFIINVCMYVLTLEVDVFIIMYLKICIAVKTGQRCTSVVSSSPIKGSCQNRAALHFSREFKPH